MKKNKDVISSLQSCISCISNDKSDATYDCRNNPIVYKVANLCNQCNLLNLYNFFNQYTNQEKILLLSYESNNIKQISEIIKITRQAVTKNVNQLNKEGYLEVYNSEKNCTYYKTTQFGNDIIEKRTEEIINNILDIEEKKKLQLRDEAEQKSTADYMNNKIQAYETYFSDNKTVYQDQINQDQTVYVKFGDIISNLYEMGNGILDDTDEEFKCIKIGFNRVFDDYKGEIRIIELPKTEKFTLGEIRKEHLGKLISIPATVISYSDIMPLTKIIKCECPACGNVISVIQKEKFIKVPKQCGCGRKGKFRILKTTVADCQILKLEELPELLGIRTQQSQIKAVIENDLCGYKYQHYYQESNPMLFNCIVRQEQIKDNSTMNILYLEIHSIEMDKSLREVKILKEDIEIIKQFSTKNPIKKLISYIAPEIIERDLEKIGLLLSIVSGGNIKTKKRDDSHVLLVGDPSLGKSTLINSLRQIYPLCRWVSGKGSSSVGLTGSVKKDKATEDVMVVKGALALANNSVVLCDELDKMDSKDRDGLHEPMENQFVSIDKYNKHVMLSTDTGLIACANPKYGRFDSYQDIIKQINLPSTLISRFDLIFAMVDKPNAENDKKTAKAIMDSFDKSEPGKDELELIRKYIYYCRNKINPKLSNITKEYFEKYYVSLRKKSEQEGKVHITARQLEGLVRLSKASAKLNLRTDTNETDAKLALKVMRYSYSTLGVSNADEIVTGMTEDLRDKFTIFDELFDSLKDKDNKVLIIELVDKYKEYDIIVEKLLERGDYFKNKEYLVKT